MLLIIKWILNNHKTSWCNLYSREVINLGKDYGLHAAAQLESIAGSITMGALDSELSLRYYYRTLAQQIYTQYWDKIRLLRLEIMF